MKHIIKMPKSKFIVIACRNCKNSQIIFNKASTKIVCVNCKEVLAEPTGGGIFVKGKVLQQLG
jgi:ribosomal protein S27E